MNPPSKRPRLSIFCRDPTGTELDAARLGNDITLKSRFESIFQKYAQDFTGIGDEIDVLTGEVIVNNGHLESIETETDLGIDHLAGDFLSTGKSMLRAMTVNLNPDLPGPDDVLMSIETIAQNAALADGSSSEESNDDLFETSRLSSESRPNSLSNTITINEADASMEPYNSDSDSLFGAEGGRARSVDSLFIDSASQDRDGNQSVSPIPNSVQPIPPLSRSVHDDDHNDQHNNGEDDEIIARFGPYVGKEVLNMIGQRQEAHIEPAWRIPVNLKTSLPHRSMPSDLYSSPIQESPQGKRHRSLWKLPNPSKRAFTKQATAAERNREESIDPLQEDHLGESEILNTLHQEQGRVLTTADLDSDPEFQPEGSPLQDLSTRDFSSGHCPYCQVHFGNKSGLMAHWDRLLRHRQKRSAEDDPHDFDMMKQIRATAVVRIRLPRLVVYDFRTMVELHEGAGLSFEEIVKSKTLRTRKTGLQLQDIYNKHRTPPGCHEHRTNTRAWTQQEEESLRKLSENPLATISTLRRGLKARGELEIGNHLADLWLAQLGTFETSATLAANPTNVQKGRADAITSGCHQARPRSSDNCCSDSTRVKQEDSDDELFIE